MVGTSNNIREGNNLNDVDISLIIDTLHKVLKGVVDGNNEMLPKDITVASTLASLKLSGALLGKGDDEKNAILYNDKVNWNEVCGYNFSKETKDSISSLFSFVKKHCKPFNSPKAVGDFELMRCPYKDDKRFNSEGKDVTFYSEFQGDSNGSVIGATEVSLFLDVDKFKDSFVYTCFEDYYDEMQKNEYIEAFKKLNISSVITYQLSVEIFKQYLKGVNDPKITVFIERLDRFMADYIDNYRGQDNRYLLECLDALPTCPLLTPESISFEDISESKYERVSNLKFKLNGKFMSGNDSKKKPSKLIELKIRDYENLDPNSQKSMFIKYVFLNYLKTGTFDVSKNGLDSKTISKESMKTFQIDHDFYDMLADILFEKSKTLHNLSSSFYLCWFEKIEDNVLDNLCNNNADKLSIFKYIRPVSVENKSNYNTNKIIKLDYTLKSKSFYKIKEMGTNSVIMNTDPSVLINPLCFSSYPLKDNGLYSTNEMNDVRAFFMRTINPTKGEDRIEAFIKYSLINRRFEIDVDKYLRKENEKYKDFKLKIDRFKLNFDQYFDLFSDSKQNVFTFLDSKALAEQIENAKDLPITNATNGYVIYHICLTLLISMYIYCVYMQEESIVFITSFIGEFESIREGLLSNDSKSMDSSNFTYGLINAIEKVFHNEKTFVVSQGYTEGIDKNKRNNGVKSSLLKFPKELYFNSDNFDPIVLDGVAVLYVTTRISDKNFSAEKIYIKCSEGHVFRQKDGKIISEFISGSEDCLTQSSLWNIENDSDLYLLIKDLEEKGVKDIIYIMDSPYSSSTAYADKDNFVGFDKELFNFLSKSFSINFIPLYTSGYQIFSNNVSAIIKGLQDRFLNGDAKPSPSSILPVFAFELGSGGISGVNKFGYKNGRLYKAPYDYYEGRTGECISELLITDSPLNKKVMLALMFLHYITNEKANSPYAKNYPFSNLKDRIMSNTTNGYDIANNRSMGSYNKNHVKINCLPFVKIIWDVINKKSNLGGD